MIVLLLTFPSICGGPGAFGVFDVDIEPERFVFDPNALAADEFNADDITFELDVLLNGRRKKNVKLICFHICVVQ